MRYIKLITMQIHGGAIDPDDPGMRGLRTAISRAEIHNGKASNMSIYVTTIRPLKVGLSETTGQDASAPPPLHLSAAANPGMRRIVPMTCSAVIRREHSNCRGVPA